MKLAFIGAFMALVMGCATKSSQPMKVVLVLDRIKDGTGLIQLEVISRDNIVKWWDGVKGNRQLQLDPTALPELQYNKKEKYTGPFHLAMTISSPRGSGIDWIFIPEKSAVRSIDGFSRLLGTSPLVPSPPQRHGMVQIHEGEKIPVFLAFPALPSKLESGHFYFEFYRNGRDYSWIVPYHLKFVPIS